MWVATTDLPVSPGYPFYAKLSAILDDAGFNRFAEEQCRSFYALVMGRPSLPRGGCASPEPRPTSLTGISHRLHHGLLTTTEEDPVTVPHWLTMGDPGWLCLGDR